MADFPGTAGDDLIDGTATDDTISDGGAGNDTLNGGDGDDVITTIGGADTIDGGDGTDRLVINVPINIAVGGSTVTGVGSGTFIIDGVVLTYQNIEGITYTGASSNEIVTFGSGNHIVNLNGGNDILFMADGSSSINGNSGSDTVNYRAATAGLTADLQAGTVTGATVSDTIVSFESFVGSDFNDLLIAGSTTTSLGGVVGNDVLDTGTRIGFIDLAGGDGNDVFVIRNGATANIIAVNLFQRAGQDRVETDIASYTLTTGVEDLEYFGSAAFTGTGNEVANVIVGGAMGDTLSGLAGDDNLAGEGGDDVIDGGDGNDRLIGGTGADSMTGGAGNDTMIVDNGGDTANGGDGIDSVQLTASGLSLSLHSTVENVTNSSGGAATVTLNALANIYGGAAGIDAVVAGDGDDIVYGRGGDDNVQGGNGNDRIFGDDGADTMTGGSGNDTMYGGIGGDRLTGNDGNDVMWGGDGSDVLNGSAGQDVYYGGTGFDFFQFGGLFIDGNTAPGTGNTLATADRIMDYSAAQSDRFDLQQVDANTNLAGDQAFSFLGTGAFTGVAGQLRYQVMGSETIIMGDLNGDGASDFMIRVSGVHALAEGSFFL